MMKCISFKNKVTRRLMIFFLVGDGGGGTDEECIQAESTPSLVLSVTIDFVVTVLMMMTDDKRCSLNSRVTRCMCVCACVRACVRVCVCVCVCAHMFLMVKECRSVNGLTCDRCFYNSLAHL